MTGWKTRLAAVLIILAAVAKELPYSWAEPLSELLFYAGNALGLVGIGHKIEKARL